jgi:hypothetical protein
MNESGYTGMFFPLIANGKIATGSPDNQHDNAFNFTGVAPGSTTATVTDTASPPNSVTLQIVVQ